MSTHVGDSEKRDPRDCNEIRQEHPPCFCLVRRSVSDNDILCVFCRRQISLLRLTVDCIDLFEWTKNLQAGKAGVSCIDGRVPCMFKLGY
jgi:hypothetical protein